RIQSTHMNLLSHRIWIVLLSSVIVTGMLSACSGTSAGTSETNTESSNIASDSETRSHAVNANNDSSITVPDGILNDRDMAFFDNGGYVKSCQSVYVNELEDCLTRREAARKFVFDHWTQKHRGYVQIGQPCAD